MTASRRELWILVLVTVTSLTACKREHPIDESPSSGGSLDGFTVVHEPPLRILGDEAPEVVAARANHTIGPAAGLLSRDFFDAAPAPTLDVWLFRDATSTATYTQQLFGHPPDPPEGYYSTVDHAVVVDLSAASPVHYLVHAFMHTNFPGCPVWFDEGLASLFEVWSEDDGRIVGQLDDQLGPLQDDIHATRLPTLQQLTALDQAEFHGQGWEVHRRMARYLCYHLQHERELRSFYRALVTSHSSDPDGYETLRTVLDQDDLVAFQGSWENWVLTLTNEE